MSDAQGGLEQAQAVHEAVQSVSNGPDLTISDRPNTAKQAGNTPDWTAIKEDFAIRGLPCKFVADKHGVSYWQLYKKSQREGWSKTLSPVKKQAKRAVQHAVASTIAQAIKRVEPEIRREVQEWQERIKKTGGRIIEHADRKLSNHEQDTKDLRELASTADIADRMVRRSLGLDSPDQSGSSRPTVLALSVRLESLGLSEQSPVPACIDVETVKEGPDQAGNGLNET